MSAPRTSRWATRAAWLVLTLAIVGLVVMAAIANAPDSTLPLRGDGSGSADAGDSPTTPAPPTDLEAEVVALANLERTAEGIASLQVAPELTVVAREHSVVMADDDHLHHNPGLTDAVSDWRIVGENVGRGPSVQALHRALMDSPSHRDNILDDRYTQIGVGIERRGGTVWVTQVFRTPTDAVAAGRPDGQPPGATG